MKAQRFRAAASMHEATLPVTQGGVNRPSRPYLRPALVVAGAYLVAGGLWILASEWLLATVVPEERTTLLEVLRGLGFVLVTSVALYVVLGRMMRDLEEGARNQASLAARLRERSAQQRLLSQRLLQAEEETRRAVAKDLHDGPLQSLTLSFMRLDAATRDANLGEAGAQPIDVQQVAAAMAAIREASEEIRGVVRALHPPLLAEIGLAAAIERHCREMTSLTGREVRFVSNSSSARLMDTKVDPDLAIVAFRVTQEAAANALKHTAGDPILVRLAIREDAVEAEVIDQGPGFNPETRAGSGLGLLSMRERAESVGGSLTLESTASGGTHVRAILPIEAAPAS